MAQIIQQQLLTASLDNPITARPTKTTGIKASTVMPAISFEVHLGLTICFISLYTLLFFFTLVQLFLILHHKHRRFSYQSMFLFVCLLWAGIRTTLFSFYFNDCNRANNMDAFPNWFLYALPIYLQFLMLTILTLYMVKLMLKSGRTSLEPSKYKNSPYVVFVVTNVVFLVVNITSSLICPDQDHIEDVVIARVIINQTLFVMVGFILCFAIRKITRISTANLFLEGQGTTGCQVSVICVIVVLLYISRAVYNIVAVTVPHDMSSFGYGWINVSDQGEINNRGMVKQNITNLPYISYGVVLVVWEVLPTSIVVWFFRVRKPQTATLGPGVIASNSFDKRSYFFDNPRRYDSEEDLNAPVHRSNYDIPGVLSPSSSINTVPSRSYGSQGHLRGSNSFNRSSSYPNAYIPGTTPPLLFTSGQHGYQKGALETVKDVA